MERKYDCGGLVIFFNEFFFQELLFVDNFLKTCK